MSADPTPLGPALAGLAASLVLDIFDRAEWAADRIGQQRHRLPRLMWNAVVLRDNRVCQICRSSTQRKTVPPEVDHIRPWSAGGADHPINLRTLCQPCNQTRSNRVSGRERRADPIVFCCTACSTLDVGQAQQVRGFCTTCRSRQVPFVSNLMIGGQVPADAHLPAAQIGDPVGPAWALAPIGRAIPVLKQRALALTVPCSWCDAPAGQACVGSSGPLIRSAAHPSRVAAASIPVQRTEEDA